MPQIAPAVSSDGPSILALSARIPQFSAGDAECIEELWMEYLDKAEASGYIFTAYRQDQDLLGFACFGPTPLTVGTWDLYWIAVDPAAQGQGIGHALMERVEAEIRARGGRLLLIETSGTRPYAPTRRFYESCGCHYQAIVHDFYEPGDDLIIFAERFPAT
jgi:ribosomal protein S18 acetylase RimI-like enzyme